MKSLLSVVIIALALPALACIQGGGSLANTHFQLNGILANDLIVAPGDDVTVHAEFTNGGSCPVDVRIEVNHIDGVAFSEEHFGVAPGSTVGLPFDFNVQHVAGGELTYNVTATYHLSSGGPDSTVSLFGVGSEGTETIAADVTRDLAVNYSDILAVIAAWGTANIFADVDDSGLVNVRDLLAVIWKL